MAQTKVYWKVTTFRRLGDVPLKVSPYYLSEDDAIAACPAGAWVERFVPKQGKVDVGWRDERTNQFRYA